MPVTTRSAKAHKEARKEDSFRLLRETFLRNSLAVGAASPLAIQPSEIPISYERSSRVYDQSHKTSSTALQEHSSIGIQTASKAKKQPKPLTVKPVGSVQSPEEASDGDLDDEYVRCICGISEDDPIHAMICCDTCSVWQHNTCMGLSVVEEELPEKYYCEMCQPQDHHETLQALKRGERIWKTRFEQTWESRVMVGFRRTIQA